MCGIAGYAGFNDERLLARMGRALRHRGPDSGGFFHAPGVGLAHRRLSIIDLQNGSQPMTNESGSLQLVFNGEIYNYQQLTGVLEARGHRFATRSDTETILHLYEEHGLDCVAHLRGMFAFALWDAARGRLLLARDRLGEKPLYYTLGDGRIAFGSEIKAILPCLPERTVNPRAVCEFLAAGYVPAPRSFFGGIQNLPPGCLLVFEQGAATVHRYWHLRQQADPPAPFEEAGERLAAVLQESVALCLKSDVEVGAFLSGGLDSSLIVALMRECGADVQTFSVGYRGAAAGFNELHHARAVSKLLGTRHHELLLGAASSLHLLPRILAHYDEPHGEPTSILVYQLSGFTRGHVTVSLGGTGSDELFYGYPRHKAIRWLHCYNLLPRTLRQQVIGRVAARFPESTRGSRFAKRAKRFIAGATSSPSETYLNWLCLLSREVRGHLISPALAEQSDDPLGDGFLRDQLAAPAAPDLYTGATNIDVGYYLADYQLAYMDRMSMAHGLEVRSPFCDFRLAQYAASLPPAYRLKGSRSKHILKEIAGRWLPQSIINRPKTGFDSPIGQWLKDELRPFLTGFLAEDQLRQSGLLDPPAVTRLVGEHLAGRKDHSLQLWSILALEAWYRIYIEGRHDGDGAVSILDVRGSPAACATLAAGCDM